MHSRYVQQYLYSFSSFVIRSFLDRLVGIVVDRPPQVWELVGSIPDCFIPSNLTMVVIAVPLDVRDCGVSITTVTSNLIRKHRAITEQWLKDVEHQIVNKSIKVFSSNQPWTRGKRWEI